MSQQRPLWTRGLFLGFMIAFCVAGWFFYFQGKKAFDLADQVRYLEPRIFEELTVFAVGTSGSTENPSRRGPAIGVGHGKEVLLVDAGRAVAEGLRNCTVPVQQPRTVYLTSLLPENTVGLDDLLLTGWRGPRTEPLRIVGPPGTRALTDALLAAHRTGIAAERKALALPAAGARFEVVEIDAAWEERRGEIRVRALPLKGGPYAALAYRFDVGQRGVVVSSAQWDRPALRELARNAWVAVLQGYSARSLEAALSSPGVLPEEREALLRDVASLPSLAQTGALAKEAGVYKLVLVRLRPPPIYDRPLIQEVREEFTGILLFAEDGEEITP